MALIWKWKILCKVIMEIIENYTNILSEYDSILEKRLILLYD